MDGGDGEDKVPRLMTHAEVLDALAREGFQGSLINTGGGCLAYEFILEAGRYVLVTSTVDVLGHVRTADDEGWSAGVYCPACGEGHNQPEAHANVSTKDSSVAALVRILRELLLAETRLATTPRPVPPVRMS